MFHKSTRLLVLCIFYFFYTSNSQEYHFSLNYEEFGVFFSPRKCSDTVNFTLSGKYQGYKFKLYLKDCRGEAYFELYDKKNVVRITGNYDNALDTLKKYRLGRFLAESEGIEKYRISTIRYLYPLKAKQWIYYEGEGSRRRGRTVNYVYSVD